MFKIFSIFPSFLLHSTFHFFFLLYSRLPICHYLSILCLCLSLNHSHSFSFNLLMICISVKSIYTFFFLSLSHSHLPHFTSFLALFLQAMSHSLRSISKYLQACSLSRHFIPFYAYFSIYVQFYYKKLFLFLSPHLRMPHTADLSLYLFFLSFEQTLVQSISQRWRHIGICHIRFPFQVIHSAKNFD